MKCTVNYGHGPLDSGGYDPGAIGPTGYQEATENREVGSKVAAKLRANGWNILAIQDGDLGDITNQSNAFGADYFISIHANAAVPEAHGVETYALSSGGKGGGIAQEIQRELVAATGLTDRGVKTANYWVLKYTDCPAVLVEVGFISNPVEESLMKQNAWDEKVASAICRGFSRAVGVAYTEEKEEECIVDVAVLLFSKEDYWSGTDVAAKNGNCAIFVRPEDRSVPADAMLAKKLIVIGGPTTKHTNELLLSGHTKFDTAAAVAKYLA